MKNPYQDNDFETLVDLFALADEVRYGYKVFRELISQHKKLVLPLHEIQQCETEQNGDSKKITFNCSKL